MRVSNWEECIKHSRIHFEKWFNHKPKQLIHSIPLDKTTDNQTKFWDSKKVPNAIAFDAKDSLHLTFIKQFALLTASANDVPIGNIDDEFIIGVIDSVEVPEFVPREKYIQTEDDDNDDQVNNNHNDGGNFSYLKDNDDHLSFVYSAAVSFLHIHFYFYFYIYVYFYLYFNLKISFFRICVPLFMILKLLLKMMFGKFQMMSTHVQWVQLKLFQAL